jgi:RNase adaptor protein for sRNA GlmZ degradation
VKESDKEVKKITFYSFGHCFPEHYPRPPEESSEQHIISLVSTIPDPYHAEGLNLKENGLDPNVQKFIREKGERIIHGLTSLLACLISSFLNNEKKMELKIYFGCLGGWQRSVFMADHFQRWAKNNTKNHKPKCEITVVHISMSNWEK